MHGAGSPVLVELSARDGKGLDDVMAAAVDAFKAWNERCVWVMLCSAACSVLQCLRGCSAHRARTVMNTALHASCFP